MSLPDPMPRYDTTQTYAWNFDRTLEPVECEVPAVPGDWSFCGLDVDSPIGIPAGPLLHGGWILYYASLGFDVLTYKTVRSKERPSYPPPNLLPVEPGPRTKKDGTLRAASEMQGTWAVSFGMPSQSPDFWRRDIEETRNRLPAGKLLSVSVVGTMEEGWGLEELAKDYALCAKWAAQSGADCIETNFSCPNVASCDGQLYQSPPDAAMVAKAASVRSSRPMPYLLKIGHVPDGDLAQRLLREVGRVVDGLAMANGLSALVEDSNGDLQFGGQRRGICGDAIREACLNQVDLFRDLIQHEDLPTRIVGLGGVSTLSHIHHFRMAGAEAVHLATAAMIDPLVALKIRKEWAGEESTPAG